MTGKGAGYGLYWRIWAILLALTLLMLLLDGAPLGRGVLIAILMVAMLTKAALVAGYFMHLRFESVTLGLSVGLGLLLLGAILFILLMPDGYRILELSGR